MTTLKKVWITEWPTALDLFSLSLESAQAEPEYARVHVEQNLFPAVPTPERPLRHVVKLGLLNRDDLVAIRDAIDRTLDGERIVTEERY
jgi:hypothetical protein